MLYAVNLTVFTLTAKPPMDRTVATDQMCLLAGHIVSVKDGALCFDPPTLHPTLRRQVEANKAALIAHLRKVKAMPFEMLRRCFQKAVHA